MSLADPASKKVSDISSVMANDNNMNGQERVIAYRTADSFAFFYGICSSDDETRSLALNGICEVFNRWLDGYGSPPGGCTADVMCGSEYMCSSNPRIFIREQLPDLLRLSIDCPFSDVRERCSEILSDLQSRGIEIPRKRFTGVSSFIPSAEAASADETDKITYKLLVMAYLQNNRLEHLFQVMAYHPPYLECFLRTQQYLMRGDGPLPFNFRHYIAIMASGQHKCTYLINIQTSEYLLQCGDEQWLQSLECIPSKLSKLSEVNELLRYQPWLISEKHIEKLAKGEDNWSISELMQAFVLLIHFQSLSSFVFGCGVNPEADHPDGHIYGPTITLENSTNCNKEPLANAPEEDQDRGNDSGIKLLVERMTSLTEDCNRTGISEEELLQRFEKIETENVELIADCLQFSSTPSSVYSESLANHLQQQELGGQEPNMKRSTYRFQDYSWEDHGYSLSNRLYLEIGTLLDEKLIVAQNLTYHTMGESDCVDTSSFRQAIWNYVQCLYGIRHDDYDYDLVDRLLEEDLKSYIRIVSFHPERVTKDDYNRFMPYLKHSEKVHINLILLEARLQAQLLYSLRAITRYMT